MKSAFTSAVAAASLVSGAVAGVIKRQSGNLAPITVEGNAFMAGDQRFFVDNSGNHDEAMKMLDEAGIYLALDASTPKYSLNRESLETLHQSYNAEYLQHLFSTIDTFAGYNNLFVFFSGNEVIPL